MRFARHSLTILCPLVFALLNGCSSQAPMPSSQSLPHDYQLNRTLSDRCGTIQSDSSKRVITFLTERLVSATNRLSPLRFPLSLKFVACSEPLAFSLGTGAIIFSQGLVKKLPLESQLAFVIAHELGHEALDHLSQIGSNASADSPTSESRRFEHEADGYAVKLLILAGYDPHAAISTIEALMQNQKSDLAHGGYPSLTSRLKDMQHLVLASHWEGPGIANRRDYLKLRNDLLQTP